MGCFALLCHEALGMGGKLKLHGVACCLLSFGVTWMEHSWRICENFKLEWKNSGIDSKVGQRFGL